METECGLLLSPERARKLAPVINAFLSSIGTLAFDAADAQAAVDVRAAPQRQEQPIGAYGILIAGCGLARGLIVVTSNVGEFQRVSCLIVESWCELACSKSS